MVSGRRPSKTRGFLRFSKRPRNPLRTLGWSTLENSWFFDPLRTLGWSTFETRGFLRFSIRPRDPLRTLGWSSFENSWFFAIFQIARATLCGLWASRPSKTRGFLTFFKSPARPSADFGLVDLRKLMVFCDFQIARATLCGLWAGRPSETRGFLRFSIRPRNPLRSLGWSTFENSWFFAISKSPARPSAQFRVVESLSLRRGTHFLAAVNPKPLASQGDLLQSALDASSKPLPSHWDCF